MEPRLSIVPEKLKKDYRIRFDLICLIDFLERETANWINHPVTIKMVEILGKRDRSSHKDVSALFNDLLSNPMVDLEIYRDVFLKGDRDAMREILTTRTFFQASGYFHYIYPFRYFGVNLCCPLELLYRDDGFPELFAFRFSKTINPSDFLVFHFQNSFSNDGKLYSLFISQILTDHSEMLGSRRDLFCEFKDYFSEQKGSKQDSEPNEANTVKKIRIKVIPLPNLFTPGYSGEVNAKLFRSEIIFSLLKGKDINERKKLLNQVANYLFDKGIWMRKDLESLADTLKDECELGKLSSKLFQSGEAKPLPDNLKRKLDAIQWQRV